MSVRLAMEMSESHFSRLLKRLDWKAWMRAQGLDQVTLTGKQLALVWDHRNPRMVSAA
jgi:hypothetical protein